jgi:hypothetical protein
MASSPPHGDGGSAGDGVAAPVIVSVMLPVPRAALPRVRNLSPVRALRRAQRRNLGRMSDAGVPLLRRIWIVRDREPGPHRGGSQ